MKISRFENYDGDLAEFSGFSDDSPIELPRRKPVPKEIPGWQIWAGIIFFALLFGSIAAIGLIAVVKFLEAAA